MHTTLANVARAVNIDPKQARQKFRSLKAFRPFDHTKLHELTKADAVRAAKFLTTDYRTKEAK